MITEFGFSLTGEQLDMARATLESFDRVLRQIEGTVTMNLIGVGPLKGKIVRYDYYNECSLEITIWDDGTVYVFFTVTKPIFSRRAYSIISRLGLDIKVVISVDESPESQALADHLFGKPHGQRSTGRGWYELSLADIHRYFSAR